MAKGKNYGVVQECKEISNYYTSALKTLYPHKQERYGRLKKWHSIYLSSRTSATFLSPPCPRTQYFQILFQYHHQITLSLPYDHFIIFGSVRSSMSHNCSSVRPILVCRELSINIHLSVSGLSFLALRSESFLSALSCYFIVQTEPKILRLVNDNNHLIDDRVT